MNHRFLLPVAALLAFAPLARAAVSPVSMRIEQVSKSENEKHKHTQNRSLKVFLTNGSAQDRKVTITYYFFGKGVKDRDIVVMEKGEKAADVPARKTEIVETPKISKTYLDDHTEGGKDGKGGGKKVEASGDKLVGYGARLYEDGKLLTEYFSQESYKKIVGDK